MTSQREKTMTIKKEYKGKQGSGQNKRVRIDTRDKLLRLGESIGSRYKEQELKMIVQILKDIIYKKQVERRTDLLGPIETN